MPAPLSGRKPGSVRARLADALSGAAAGIRQTARAGHRLRQRRAHRPPPDRTGLRDHGRGHVPAPARRRASRVPGSPLDRRRHAPHALERNLPRADRLAQLLSSEARRPAAPVRHLRTPGRARRPDVHQRDHTGEAIGELEGQPLYHGSLDRQEYRDLLEANGFEVVRYVEWDEECGRANVWLARRGGAVEGETRQPRITAVPGEISRG